MNLEEQSFLLRDLCARLPYWVKCKIEGYKPLSPIRLEIDYINGHLVDFGDDNSGIPIQVYLSEIKPYLFPLNSMTESQKRDLDDLSCHIGNNRWLMLNHKDGTIYKSLNAEDIVRCIDWLNANHFDYRDLIEKGLAINAAGLNIY